MKEKFDNPAGSTRPCRRAAAALLALVLAAGILMSGCSRPGEELSAPEAEETMGTVSAMAPAEPETTEESTAPTTLPYQESGKDIFNILIVGQAARAGEAKEDHRLADTLILATINKKAKTVTLTSFLRDTYVKLPNFVEASGKKHTCGKNRINVAYNLGYVWGGTGGAMQMMNDCLLENFGVEVDYDIEVDFQGFIDMIDMLDGIEVELTEEEAAYLNRDRRFVYYEVFPGTQRLDGMAALSYARMRKSNAKDSDIRRTSRQRELIMNLLDKLRTRSFQELQELAGAVLPMVTTNMTDEEILTLIWEVLPLLPELEARSRVIPAEGTWSGRMVDIGGWPSSVLSFNEEKNRAIMEAITKGLEDEAQPESEPPKNP